MICRFLSNDGFLPCIVCNCDMMKIHLNLRRDIDKFLRCLMIEEMDLSGYW